MKRSLILAVATVLGLAGSPAWANQNSVANGDWSTPGTWTTAVPTGTDVAAVKNGFTVTITQAGEVASELDLVAPVGTLTMTSGGLTLGATSGTGNALVYSGTLNLNGGALTATGNNGNLQLSYDGNTGPNAVVNVSLGTHSIQGNLSLTAGSTAQTASYNQTGGTVTYGNASSNNGFFLLVASPTDTANLTGGDLIGYTQYYSRGVRISGQFNLGDAATTGNIKESASTGSGSGSVGHHLYITVNTNGVFRGWGTVVPTLGTGGSSQAYEPLINNGRVIADGYGNDAHVLSFPNFSSDKGGLSNTIDNTTNKGWYAQNHGKLTLGTLAVSGASPAVTWGDTISDTTPDMVNSFRLSFNGVSGSGTVAGSLLSVDRGDISGGGAPAGWGFLSVHDIATSGFTFTDYGLTLRYDDTAAAGFEDRLHLLHYTGGQWVDVNATLDMVNNTLSVAGLTSFSEFAVAFVPEPSTILLLGFGGLLLWRRRQRA